MNKNFHCLSFLDNETFAILEISTKTPFVSITPISYHWLLVNKHGLSVFELQMKSRDDSASVQERFFDMGYLKYDTSTGVFITQENNQLYPLHNISCSQIPENIRLAIENYLSQIVSLSAQ